MNLALRVPDALDDLSYWLCGRRSDQALPDNNYAVYGSCVATTYSSVDFSRGPFTLTTPGALAYITSPGTYVKITAIKKDRYGQIMASDNSSSLQLHSALSGARENDRSVTFTSSVFAGLREGKADFSLGVKPTFTSFSDTPGITQLLSQPYVYVTGTDLTDESGVLMQSEVYEWRLTANEVVCSQGYVLQLDNSRLFNGMFGRQGQCVLCDAGKYSIHPLTGDGELPDCLNCPAGGECPGGHTITFEKGTWSSDDRRFFLRSCPQGHKVINMTTISTPPSRPKGGREVAATVAREFSHDIQECALCDKGEECTAETCEICTPCAPGYYKAAVSTEACIACPKNSYRETMGASDPGMCLGCQVKDELFSMRAWRGQQKTLTEVDHSQDKSSTKELTGRSSRRACVCDVEYYLIMADEGMAQEALSCQTCPKGAKCDDSECALRNDGFNCTGGSRIVGEWETFANGQYKLQSCPYGYSAISITVEGVDASEQWCSPCGKGLECTKHVCTVCSECAAGFYKSSVSTEACTACPENTYGNENLKRTQPGYCKACPAGAECKDRSCGLRKSPFACKLVGEWILDAASSEYRLMSCPTGFKLLNSSGHDNQECQKCAENYYVMDSRNPSDICRQCPSGALFVLDYAPQVLVLSYNQEHYRFLRTRRIGRKSRLGWTRQNKFTTLTSKFFRSPPTPRFFSPLPPSCPPIPKYKVLGCFS